MIPVHNRFWKYVTPMGFIDCWLWTGAKRNGYGVLGAGRRSDSCSPIVYAHRVSYEIHHGPLKDGSFVCHHCDVRACVNPYHLYEGNYVTNIQDRWKRNPESFKNLPGSRWRKRKKAET